MTEVLLGLGGNLGDAAATIRTALDRLAARGLAVRAVSRFYRTPPWGPVAQPDYVNACARADTDLAPLDLLTLAQSVEAELGRVRDVRWGPRTIDIDLLAIAGVTLDTAALTLPHPRLTERAFALLPLAEIAPDWMVAGRSVRDWAEACDRTGIRLMDAAG